jgi:glutathione S-transferase
MDYFFSPLACSLSGHVLIQEARLPVNLVPVSLVRKQTATGQDFRKVSPKNQVPVLRFDDGRILTEVNAILQVLADMAPERGYLRPRSTIAGQRTLEWLNFVATEVHKHCLYPMFQKGTPTEVRGWARQNLPVKLDIAASHLNEHPYLGGDEFSVADLYFGWTLMLSSRAGIDLADLGPLSAYWAKLLQRPAFAECVEKEERLYGQFA